MDAAAYARQLKQLLPRGRLWSLEEGARLAKLLLALAEELARVDGRAADLLREWDPRTCDETIEDWERVLGLTPSDGATDDERRGAISGAFVAQGGQAPPYFMAVATAMGFYVSFVWESPPHDWVMAVDLGASTPPRTLQTIEFRVGASRCPDRLNAWQVPELEDLINKLKPAHSRAFFRYVE